MGKLTQAGLVLACGHSAKSYLTTHGTVPTQPPAGFSSHSWQPWPRETREVADPGSWPWWGEQVPNPGH